MAIATMNFPAAKRYAKAGYAIRRVIWGAEGVLPLAWVTYRWGLYHYTTATATRVVEAADVDVDDLRANDWTLQGLSEDPVEVPPVGELPGAGDGSGGGGTGGGSGGGAGGGGGAGPGGYPAESDGPLPGGFDNPNGGGGGDGGGDQPPPRRKRPEPTETAMTLTVSRTTDGCIPKIGGLPSTLPVEDDFSFDLELSGDTDAPAGLWFYSVHHGAPDGPKIAQSGTIAPGDTVSGVFSIEAPRGQGPFRVWAKAYRSGSGYSATANDNAEMRDEDCGDEYVLPDAPYTLAGWMQSGIGGYSSVRLEGVEHINPEDARAHFASLMSVSVEDFTIVHVGGLDWEFHLNGTPALMDIDWVVLTGMETYDSGTIGAVAWVPP